MINNPTKDLIWPFAEKLLRIILGTALTLLIARQMGPTEFGVFSTIFAIYMIFSAFAGLGLKDIIIDEIAKGKSPTHLTLNSASPIAFTANLIASAAFLTLIILTFPGYGVQFRIALILSLIFLFRGLEVLLFGLESHAKIRTISLAQQISIIISGIGKIIILWMGATAISLAAVTFIEFAILYIAAMILAFHHGLRLTRGAFHIEYAVVLLKRSWPLAVSSLAVMSYLYVDQIMITMLMDAESVGIYAAATRISQQLYILPTVLVAAYYPRLTYIYATSPEKFDEGFKALSVVLITLALLLSCLMLLLSEPILQILLGSQFKDTASILKLHAFGLIFVSLNVISGRWYVMQSIQKLTLIRQLLTAFLNAGLNLLLIPLCGLEGAIYATLISLGFLAFGFDLFSLKTKKLFDLKLNTIRMLLSINSIKSSFANLRTY